MKSPRPANTLKKGNPLAPPIPTTVYCPPNTPVIPPCVRCAINKRVHWSWCNETLHQVRFRRPSAGRANSCGLFLWRNAGRRGAKAGDSAVSCLLLSIYLCMVSPPLPSGGFTGRTTIRVGGLGDGGETRKRAFLYFTSTLRADALDVYGVLWVLVAHLIDHHHLSRLNNSDFLCKSRNL